MRLAGLNGSVFLEGEGIGASGILVFDGPVGRDTGILAATREALELDKYRDVPTRVGEVGREPTQRLRLVPAH